MLTTNVFLYWGGRKLSYLRLLTVISLRKYNPDFKITLVLPVKPTQSVEWDTKEQDGKYTGPDYLEESKRIVDEVKTFSMEEIGFPDTLPEVQKSDIVRIFLLFIHGGIWVDFDIIFFKSIPEELLGIDFVCKHPTQRYYSTMFLGARKGSEVYSKLFTKQLNSVDSGRKYQKYGTRMMRGMEFPGTKNVSMDLLCHHDSTQIQKIFTSNANLPEESIGIHWYGGNIFTRDWENKITPDNYDKLDNILGIKLRGLK